jgi:hypothetical protein
VHQSGVNIVAHTTTYQISLTSLHNHNNNHFKKIAVKINAKPYHQEGEVCITINEKGIDYVQ